MATFWSVRSNTLPKYESNLQICKDDFSLQHHIMYYINLSPFSPNNTIIVAYLNFVSLIWFCDFLWLWWCTEQTDRGAPLQPAAHLGHRKTPSLSVLAYFIPNSTVIIASVISLRMKLFCDCGDAQNRQAGLGTFTASSTFWPQVGHAGTTDFPTGPHSIPAALMTLKAT